jgi:hypothetical protein
LDNVKSLKFSWGELEGLITANEISGHRMYCGDASRPNTLTWFVTLNGASLSKDMAQRAVIIKLRKPHRTGTWKAETTDFVRRNRNALAADVVGALQSTPHPLAEFSRWATWENDILQRLPEPAETQKVVLERQHGADAETDECQILQDYFADRLVELNYDINVDRIHIPNQVFVVWFNTALHVKESTAKATRMMDVLSRDPSSGLDQIRRNPCRTGGRGFLWCGKNAPQNSQVKYDLTERLRRREERF